MEQYTEKCEDVYNTTAPAITKPNTSIAHTLPPSCSPTWQRGIGRTRAWPPLRCWRACRSERFGRRCLTACPLPLRRWQQPAGATTRAGAQPSPSVLAALSAPHALRSASADGVKLVGALGRTFTCGASLGDSPAGGGGVRHLPPRQLLPSRVRCLALVKRTPYHWLRQKARVSGKGENFNAVAAWPQRTQPFGGFN